jgi:hypothetical protein
VEACGPDCFQPCHVETDLSRGIAISCDTLHPNLVRVSTASKCLESSRAEERIRHPPRRLCSKFRQSPPIFTRCGSSSVDRPCHARGAFDAPVIVQEYSSSFSQAGKDSMDVEKMKPGKRSACSGPCSALLSTRNHGMTRYIQEESILNQIDQLACQVLRYMHASRIAYSRIRRIRLLTHDKQINRTNVMLNDRALCRLAECEPHPGSASPV